MSILTARKPKEPDINKVRLTKKEFNRQWVLILIAAIYVIYGIIFYYLPLAGWIMAFQNYKLKTGLLHSQFVGLKKFKFLFDDKVFLRVIRNTFAMGSINLVSSFITAIGFAILLSEVKNQLFKRGIQTISYMPHFLSWIIVCGIIHDSLSSTGIINEILCNMHILSKPINFFAHEQYFWPIVAISNVWKETGFNAIIYLAAITSIDPALYEAASIDGAGRFQKMLYVTLPSIRPTIMILLLINIGNVLNAGFEVQYILGNGLVQPVSETIDIYVLDFGVGQMDYSLGTAAGLFKTIVAMVLIVICNFIAKKTGDERLF